MNSFKTSLIPTNIDQAMKISEMFAKSDLVPDSYKNKPANIFLAVSAGASLGLAPFQAMQNIAVINGKPSVWGDALLAMVRNDRRCLSVKETIDGEGKDRKAYCVVSRLSSDGSTEVIKSSFSMAQASSANLLNRPPWKSYPDRMLQMRARGFALRDAFPDVIGGLITGEEADDYPVKNIVKDLEPLPKFDKDSRSIDDIVNELTPPEESEIKEEEVTIEWLVKLPGKDPIVVQNKNDYVLTYIDIMKKIYESDKLSSLSKKKKYDELKTQNMQMLEILRGVDFTLIEEIELKEGELFDE